MPNDRPDPSEGLGDSEAALHAIFQQNSHSAQQLTADLNLVAQKIRSGALPKVEDPYTGLMGYMDPAKDRT